jgi:adenylate cyclase
MRPPTKHQWTLYFFIVGVGAFIGAVSGAIVGPVLDAPWWFALPAHVFANTVDVTIFAALIGGLEVFFFSRTRTGRAFERAPFLMVYAVKFFMYLSLFVAGGAISIGKKALYGLVLNPFIVGTDLWREIDLHARVRVPVEVEIAQAILPLMLFMLLIQVSRLVGGHTLRDVAIGRYHRPRLEERFFLFLDIVGSTSLAERIGPHSVHRFLDRTFQIASDPIDEQHGEVYQYVGDEMVITWTVYEGAARGYPLACYFEIERALAKEAEEFQHQFGTVPRLRAALHAGSVIAGEVGGSRRSIVYHGDAMNTTSRIEQATRDLRRSFLVSEDAFNRFEHKEPYKFEDLGDQQLRGRTDPLRLYAVSIESKPLTNTRERATAT